MESLFGFSALFLPLTFVFQAGELPNLSEKVRSVHLSEMIVVKKDSSSVCLETSGSNHYTQKEPKLCLLV